MSCITVEIDPVRERYKLYGVNFYSDHLFYNHLYPGLPGIDLFNVVFSCTGEPPFPINWQSEKKIYSSPYLTDVGESIAGIYQYDDFQAIRFRDIADFYLTSNRIDCHLADLTPIPLMENYLFGVVMAFWLESRGIPVLHASAVSIEGQAVAFLAHSGHGKSTLAAAFLRAGHPLLSDDILPIEERQGTFWGLPGLPQIKLWPDQAAYLIGNDPGLKPVLPDISKKLIPLGLNGYGSFCDNSQPLRCIYLPYRTNPGTESSRIEVTPLRPAEAVIELARFSFIPNVVEGLGLQFRRLDFFARLIQKVPVRRICYPSGFEHLQRMTEVILQDLKSLPSHLECSQ